jgi:hypothetical protein
MYALPAHSGIYLETSYISVRRAWGFTWGTFGNGSQAGVHIWLVAIACAIATTVSWIKFPWHIFRRFSLRTFLLAITLVAVVLGAIIAFSR